MFNALGGENAHTYQCCGQNTSHVLAFVKMKKPKSCKETSKLCNAKGLHYSVVVFICLS